MGSIRNPHRDNHREEGEMIKDLGKLPKRKVKVDELLELDDFNELAAWLDEVRLDVLEAMVIVTLGDGNVAWKTTGIPLSRIIYLMRLVENEELNPKEH